METGRLRVLTVIDGVEILINADETYLRFTSNLDVCSDGSCPSHGDPHHQSRTAYYNNGKYLNADKDQYIVVPPIIRSGIKPIVMGCQGRATNLVALVFRRSPCL